MVLSLTLLTSVLVMFSFKLLPRFSPPPSPRRAPSVRDAPVDGSARPDGGSARPGMRKKYKIYTVVVLAWKCLI